MRFVLTCLLCFFLPLNLWAHPYLPLNAGSVTTLGYSFAVDSEKPELKATSVKGKIISTNKGVQQKEGKEYFRFEVTYQDIPYMTQAVDNWRREENGNVYILSERGGADAGKFFETIELPADVSVGTEWDYDDGEPSRRKVTRRLSVQLENGEKVEDCIEVTRTILKNEHLQNVKNINYYCRGKGDAGSVFIQPSPFGDYKTETKLLEFVGGEDA